MEDQRGEEVRKGAHCAWQIHYHIVFPVKYRKALLDDEVTAMIRETANEIEERFPIEMEAIGMDKNHIHLLCSAHPKMAPGRSVQIFKSLTAREIFRRKPAVKRVLWGGEFWTDGYLCGDGGGASELADRRTVCAAARGPLRRSPTTPHVLVL
ncbi:MAG TPA: IS200/IS605 family transposase [Nitrospira sp.]|nr:IS200/IS605 family transposase [Nitrospira sp.]